MHNLIIKICGIREPQLAEQAVKAGVNYIGIVFHPESKRVASIEQAMSIAKSALQAGALPVAVFVQQTAAEMQRICELTNIRMVQLHGKIAREQHYLLPDSYQRIYVQPIADNHAIHHFNHLDANRDFILFDHVDAGSGKTFDWQTFNFKFSEVKQTFRWLLAGGLSAANVSNALSQLQPDGVDVSSGVENTYGNKDINLIKDFVQAARGQLC